MSVADAISEASAIAAVMELMSIPGKSGEESGVAGWIVDKLRRAGIPEKSIQFDSAHRRSPIGGECGNLVVKLPGTLRAPRRLLMAHMDTVPLCVGCQPVQRGDFIVSSNEATALGGDNRSGAAVLLTAALTILERQLPHPPLTLFWPVQEEIGLVGARHATVAKLGKPAECFNFDGGAPHVCVIGATGAEHLSIEIEGIASHAGAHPEDGVSAAVIAAKALADLEANGWHGLVAKGRQTGTSNVGAVRGGEATNVVLDRLTLAAECRSHSPSFRSRIVEAFQKAFQRAAESTKNAAGRSGVARIGVHHKYEAFQIDRKEPCVQSALKAIAAVGMHPETRVVNGGLDANWLTAHGFPTVTLGCGQNGIHTVDETLHVPSFLAACRIGLLLAVAAE